MTFRDKMLFKGLRRRLTPRQVVLFKLAVWSALLVWMVFFTTYTIIMTQPLAKWTTIYFPGTPFYQTLARMVPFWWVFTCVLTVVLIARWARRKLRPTEGENE